MRALRQRGKCSRRFRNQHIRGIRALEHGPHLESLREMPRQILATVHSGIDRPVQERLLDLFGKKPLYSRAAAAGIGKIGALIAGCRDLFDLDLQIPVHGAQRPPDEIHLRERERAPPCPQHQWTAHDSETLLAASIGGTPTAAGCDLSVVSQVVKSFTCRSIISSQTVSSLRRISIDCCAIDWSESMS